MAEKTTSSPLRPTSSRDEVVGLNSSSSLVPGVYTGTRTKSDQGPGRGATSSPAGPEHFTVIAQRHFVRLKEITMTATAEPSPIGANFDDPEPDDRPALPSAADHYAMACRLLDEAEDSRNNLGEVHARVKVAKERLRAAKVAAWARPDRAGDRQLLEENFALSAELAKLLPVAHAARKYLTAARRDGVTPAEYNEFAAAVAKLDADL